MTVIHRWVQGVPLTPIEPQHAHVIPVAPDSALPDLFYSAICGRELMVRDGGAVPGPNAERCPDCASALADPVARARMLLALPPAPMPTPDPSMFTLVNHRLTPDEATNPFVVSSVHFVRNDELRGADKTEFPALCQEVLAWDDVELTRSDRSAAPCSGCWWVWMFTDTNGGDSS